MKREESIGFTIKTLDNVMMRNIMPDICQIKKGVMPMMQGWVIHYLYENSEKEIFQKDLESVFHIARSTVTSIVKQLEKSGYIERVAVQRDSRLKKLCLLKKGEDYQEQICANMEELERRMREGISKEELILFFQVAEKIRRNIESGSGQSRECGKKMWDENRKDVDLC